MSAKKVVYDPVCGMNLNGIKNTVGTHHNKKSYRFCHKACKDRFQKNPKRYLAEPLIRISSLKKSFGEGEGKTTVLRGVDLNIWEGDFVVIIGASGSGKSTLLNMMGLLDRPDEGHIALSGKSAAELTDEERAEYRSHLFGFVFQQFNLIPWLTAYENITLPLIFSQKDIKEKELQKNIKLTGFEHRLDHRPTQLSGGEQQRVALLRALANDPNIILGDEPTGNLDSKTGEKIMKLLVDLQKEQKKTLVIVTHDLRIARKADQVIAIKDGEIVQNHTFLE